MAPKEAVMPKHSNTNNTVGKGIPVIFGLALVLATVLLSFEASALPSETNSDGVYLDLWAGADNWTAAGATEAFNLTVSILNNTFNVRQITITLPTYGANAVFSINMSTNWTSNSSWACYSTATDSAGNVTILVCNTSTADLLNGTSINISFSASAMSLSSEIPWTWNVV
ncbi:MAG: hypothetical protein V1813_03335, partial [Candidatus Aenigmatarchaeota archaeon]